jgi:outer membrane protein assembly factor BamB
MISSVFTYLGYLAPASNAVIPASVTQPLSERSDPFTGEPYSTDLSQYTWRGQSYTWSGGDEPEATRYTDGPAPGRPDVAWKIGGGVVRSDIGSFSGLDTWMGGYVIVRSNKGGVNYINGLYPLNGTLKWQIRHPSSGAVTPLDDQHFKVNVNSGANLTWMVFNWDGTFAYNSTKGMPSGGNIYFDTEILTSTQTTGTGGNTRWWLNGRDISNIQTAGAPLVWNISRPLGAMGHESQLAYGDGKIFYGSWGDFEVVAIYVKNGTIAWQTEGKTNLRDGMYYEGKLITSGIGTRMTAYDGATGEVLWEYNAGPRGYFANVGCAAYGMIFQHNMDIPYGYFGAWNATTGELVWKIPGWYYIGYFSPGVADGKIYQIMSDGSGVSGSLDVPKPYSACIDAFTGEFLWTVPFQLGSSGFSGYVRLAYGCMWYPGGSPQTWYCVSDITPAPDWAMWGGNTEQPNVAVGQSGPSDISMPRWKYTTGGPISGSAVVSNGSVYFGSQDTYIYCLDARVGSLIWKFQTGYKVRSTPAVVGGKLYSGADDGNIYCLDAVTGDQIWKKDIDGTYHGELEYPFAGQWMVRSSPIIVGNRLYVGALDGKVYCLNTADGNTVWTFQTGNAIGGSAAYYNGVIYIASVDMFLYALNANNGTAIWQTQVGTSIQSYTGTLHGTPVVISSLGKVIILSSSGYSPRACFYYMTNGTECKFANGTLQRLPLGGSTPSGGIPTYYKGLLYVVGYWRVQCWNTEAGTRLWQVYMGHQTFSSCAIADGIDNAKIYVGDEVGAIHCITNITAGLVGKSISAFATQGLTPGIPAIWERKVYQGFSDWNLYCFSDTTVEDTAISATFSRGSVDINKSESITITGKLYSPQTNEFTGEHFTPGIPNMPVLVSVGKPDSTRFDLTTTTNAKGEFSVTYTPTAAGNYTLLAWFQGKDKVTFSYNYAFSDQFTLKATQEASPPPPPPPVEEVSGIPIEYIYAAVAIVIIVIVAIVAYMWMKRKPKK